MSHSRWKQQSHTVDSTSGKPIAGENSSLELVTCAIEPSQEQLLSAAEIDDKISLFDINKTAGRKERKNKIQLKREYNGHSGKVVCCGFLNNEYFVTGSFDSAINLWEVEQQREIKRYDDHQSEVVALDVFRMDGNIFVSGSTDLTFRVWDIRMKKACFRKFMENDCGVSAVKYMPENVNTLAVGYENKSMGICAPLAKLETLSTLMKSTNLLEACPSQRVAVFSLHRTASPSRYGTFSTSRRSVNSAPNLTTTWSNQFRYRKMGRSSYQQVRTARSYSGQFDIQEFY